MRIRNSIKLETTYTQILQSQGKSASKATSKTSLAAAFEDAFKEDIVTYVEFE